MSPPLPKRLCPYCLGMFTPARADAVTCSGDCRMAVSRALAYESYADVPAACLRRDTGGQQRREATGFGLVTASEGYQADLRVRVIIGGEWIEVAAQREALVPWEEARKQIRAAERARLDQAAALGADPDAVRALFDALCDGSASEPSPERRLLAEHGLIRYDRGTKSWVANR